MLTSSKLTCIPSREQLHLVHAGTAPGGPEIDPGPAGPARGGGGASALRAEQRALRWRRVPAGALAAGRIGLLAERALCARRGRGLLPNAGESLRHGLGGRGLRISTAVRESEAEEGDGGREGSPIRSHSRSRRRRRCG